MACSLEAILGIAASLNIQQLGTTYRYKFLPNLLFHTHKKFTLHNFTSYFNLIPAFHHCQAPLNSELIAATNYRTRVIQ